MTKNNFSSGQKAHITRLVNEAVAKRLTDLGISNIEEACDEVKKLTTKIFEGTDGETSFESQIGEFLGQIEKNSSAINLKKENIDGFYSKIFGEEDEEGNLAGGLDEEIKKKQDEMDEIKNKEEEKFDALFAKIESLLPGATSAGLAKAYKDKVKSFKWPNIWWSFIFLLSIGGMVAIAAWAFKDSQNITEVLMGLASRIAFFLPLIWLGIFSSKQQSQNKRLIEEYSHKESLAKTFEGYKREIEKLDEEDEEKEVSKLLLKELVGMAGHNPSVTLSDKNHKDSPPGLGTIEKVAEKLINTNPED